MTAILIDGGDMIAKVLGALSLIVFILSAIVHALTFVPGLPVSMYLAWPLHVATMAAFAAMIIVGVSIGKKMPKAHHSRDSLSKVLRWVPSPLILLCIAAAAYTAINFAVFMGLMGGGSPAEKEGRYYLHSHGKKIRDLEEGEYRRFRAYEVRGFSGHWMLFSLMPMTFFFYIYPEMASGKQGDGEIETGEPGPSKNWW